MCTGVPVEKETKEINSWKYVLEEDSGEWEVVPLVD
jgi:hypothetical protein